MSAVRAAPTPDPIAIRLRQRLLALEFPAFARCVCRLLEALGYEEARLAGRREWKGYNQPGGGGYDLEAQLPGGLAPRRVVAQIKQYGDLTVHQRSVDELRGACLRVGAAEGLLVTTSAFSDVVRRSASAPNTPALLAVPVRLVDGEELVGLLIRHRLGVKEGSHEWEGSQRGADKGEQGKMRLLARVKRLELDEAFFDTLVPPATPPKRSRSIPRGWRVTLDIFPESRLTRSDRRKGAADREGDTNRRGEA